MRDTISEPTPTTHFVSQSSHNASSAPASLLIPGIRPSLCEPILTNPAPRQTTQWIPTSQTTRFVSQSSHNAGQTWLLASCPSEYTQPRPDQRLPQLARRRPLLTNLSPGYQPPATGHHCSGTHPPTTTRRARHSRPSSAAHATPHPPHTTPTPTDGPSPHTQPIQPQIGWVTKSRIGSIS